MYIYCATEHKRDRVFLPFTARGQTHTVIIPSIKETHAQLSHAELAEEDSEQTLGAWIWAWEYRGQEKEYISTVNLANSLFQG